MALNFIDENVSLEGKKFILVPDFFVFFKNFIGFIDPGSFYGHNEMEVAYLRWFNPSFIDSKFLEKYNNYIKLEKNYLDYEIIYQLYYALCNVALWDRSYIKETENLLI